MVLVTASAGELQRVLCIQKLAAVVVGRDSVMVLGSSVSGFDFCAVTARTVVGMACAVLPCMHDCWVSTP
jgi:hypothetical protein